MGHPSGSGGVELGRVSATRSSPGIARLLRSSAPCIRGGAVLQSPVGRVVLSPSSTTSAAPGGKPVLFASVEI